MLCPECGTANPENSEFCINCGQNLDAGTTVHQSQAFKPKWGDEPVPNWLRKLQNTLPEDLRDPGLEDMIRQKTIVATQRMEPFTPETKKVDLVPEEELTPEIEAESEEWLNEVLASMKKDSSPVEQEPPPEEPPEEPIEADDWLRSVLDESEEEEPASVSEEEVIHPETQEETPVADSTPDEGEDWLNEFRKTVEDETTPHEIRSEPIEEEVPGWLRENLFEHETGEEVPDVTPQEEIPHSDTEPPAMPEWLKSLEEPEEGTEEITLEEPSSEHEVEPPETEIPDWLKSSTETSTEVIETIPSVQSSVPDWLRSYQEESEVQAEEPPAFEEQAMPDWLAAHIVEYPSTLTETETLPLEAVEPAPQIDEEIDTDVEGIEESIEEEIPPVEGEFPSWLEEPEFRPEEAEEVTLPQESLPSWLLDIDSEEPAEPEPPSEPVADETVKMEKTTISEEEISVSDEPLPDVEPGLAGADMPDWLQSIKDQELLMPDEDLEPEGLDEEGIEVELPDWLRADEFEPAPEESLPEPPQAETTEEAVEEEEVGAPVEGTTPESEYIGETKEPAVEEEIDWLKEMPDADLETATEALPTPDLAADTTEFDEFEGEGELPDWIRDIEDQSEEAPLISDDEIFDEALLDETEMEGTIPLSRITPGEIPADRSEMPEWLRELRDQEPFDEMEPPVWLTESEAEISDELSEEEVPELREETPGWLAGISLDEEESESEDVPDWLRDVDETEVDLVEEFPETEETEIPSWLKQMSELEDSEQVSPQEDEDVEQIRPLPSEQPTVGAPSLKLPAEEPLPESELTEGRQEETAQPRRLPLKEGAILAGISAALNAETAISTPKPGQDLILKPVPEGTAQAQVFEEIVSQPLVPRSTAVVHKRSRLWGKLSRILLYLLIIASVAVTLYWQGALEIGFVSEYNIPISVQTQEAYDRINAVSDQATVLLILDYEPSLAEELNLQARALLRNFMEHRFKILLASTTLTGPQIAQNMMDSLASQPEFNYEYGEDYINLGYLPGQEASLMMFGQSPLTAVQVDFRNKQNLTSYPISQKLQDVPLKGWNEVVPLIVNLSSNQETLRIWIEQVVAANEDINMIAGVSAGLVPYVQPYLESGQLVGVLGGLTSAAEYESLALEPGRAIRSIDSQMAVHLIIAGVIILGNFAYLIKRTTKRRR